MEFVLDGGEGAEEQVAGVGHDGGAARWDAVLGLVEQEAGKKLVDGDGGLELGETGGEDGGEVVGLDLLLMTAQELQKLKYQMITERHGRLQNWILI